MAKTKRTVVGQVYRAPIIRLCGEGLGQFSHMGPSFQMVILRVVSACLELMGGCSQYKGAETNLELGIGVD